jgi:hypothetical protein
MLQRVEWLQYCTNIKKRNNFTIILIYFICLNNQLLKQILVNNLWGWPKQRVETFRSPSVLVLILILVKPLCCYVVQLLGYNFNNYWRGCEYLTFFRYVLFKIRRHSLHRECTVIWRWQVRTSSYNSNKSTNQMQQFYLFITWRFVSLNVFWAPPRPSSGAYNCVNSLWFYRWSVVVATLLVVVGQTTTNNFSPPPPPPPPPNCFMLVAGLLYWLVLYFAVTLGCLQFFGGGGGGFKNFQGVYYCLACLIQTGCACIEAARLSCHSTVHWIDVQCQAIVNNHRWLEIYSQHCVFWLSKLNYILMYPIYIVGDADKFFALSALWNVMLALFQALTSVLMRFRFLGGC